MDFHKYLFFIWRFGLSIHSDFDLSYGKNNWQVSWLSLGYFTLSYWGGK